MDGDRASKQSRAGKMVSWSALQAARQPPQRTLQEHCLGFVGGRAKDADGRQRCGVAGGSAAGGNVSEAYVVLRA